MSNINYDPREVDRGEDVAGQAEVREIRGYGQVPPREMFPQHDLAGVHGDGFEPVSSRKASLETEKRANVAHRGVKQSRDRAQYVRQQKGHSFILEVLVFGIFTFWIRPIYLAASPNHFFHL